METNNDAVDQTLNELLTFVEVRAAEDQARPCALCPNNAHLPDVGTMARAWTTRVRDSGANPRRSVILRRIASLHRDHPVYPRRMPLCPAVPRL